MKLQTQIKCLILSFLVVISVFGLVRSTSAEQNMSPTDGTHSNGGVRCDSQGTKDCWGGVDFDVPINDSINYQAWLGEADTFVQQEFGTDNQLMIQLCFTNGGWGNGVGPCNILYNAWGVAVSEIDRVYYLNNENIKPPPYDDTDYNYASFHIYVKKLYTASNLSAAGRRVYVNSFKANGNSGSTTIAPGQTIPLAWQTTFANAVSIDNGVGSVSGSGSVNVTPLATTTYTIAANGPGHNGATTVTTTVTVNVTTVPVPGCTDSTATNYNPSATEDDGSCIPPPSGGGGATCQDAAATNFGGSLPCTYPPGGGTGTVCVNANTMDAYYVTGPNQLWGWNGSNCFAGHPTGSYSVSASGATSITPASAILNSGQTITFTVTFGGVTPPPDGPPGGGCSGDGCNPPPPVSGSFQITYTLVGINTPTVTSINNSTCGKLTVNWTFSGTGYENALDLYRSTDNATWGYLTQFGTGTTSYQDTPPDNATYYYMLRSHSNTPYSRESGNSNSMSAFNQSCLANLSNSSKILLLDNGAAYTALTQIQTGDVLTFQITIVNAGPTAATINFIDDALSANLSNPRNLKVDKNGNGVYNETGESGTITGSAPNIRLNVSGAKPVGNPNWVIKLDATVATTATSQFDQLSNVGTINYTDSTTKNQTVSTGQILFRTGQGKAPNFLEVAP